MIGTGVLLVFLLRDGVLGRPGGFFLVFLLGVYLWVLLQAGVENEPVRQNPSDGWGGLWTALLGVALGIVLLVAGAQALVGGAIELARIFGVSERVVGLTMVAVGSSLPELAVCLVAALKRQGDLVLGNLIGSNVFNVLFVLGLTALVRPLSVSPEVFIVDLLVMLGLSFLVLPFLFTGRRLGRREGAVLLGIYSVYVFFLYG